jgi:AbiTii
VKGQYLKLLDEIIGLLSDETASLTAAMLKTKVLLHKIGHKELVEWVNNELNGYPDGTTVPPYRVLPAIVLANAANLAYQISGHPIPILHLDKEYRENLETARMDQSLAVLEKYSNSGKGYLERHIPMEANGLLGKSLSNGYMIQRAWSQISITDVNQILVQVRSRLLDFTLELKSEIGDAQTDEEIEVKKEKVDAAGLFNHAIFGHNTTIVVGNNNIQSVGNQNAKGDMGALLNELRRVQVSEQDLDALQSAIYSDAGSQEHEAKKFGAGVRQWLGNMMSKAAATSWQIELGIAGNLLTSALQNYYGW